MREIPPDVTGHYAMQVEPRHTALAMGNPGMDVLSTPFVVLMVEVAAHEAIVSYLEEGEGVAGTHIDLRHLAPTSVGRQVEVDARLTARNGRRCTFAVRARSGGEIIADGTYESMIVVLARVLERAHAQGADT